MDPLTSIIFFLLRRLRVSNDGEEVGTGVAVTGCWLETNTWFAPCFYSKTYTSPVKGRSGPVPVKKPAQVPLQFRKPATATAAPKPATATSQSLMPSFVNKLATNLAASKPQTATAAPKPVNSTLATLVNKMATTASTKPATVPAPKPSPKPTTVPAPKSATAPAPLPVPEPESSLSNNPAQSIVVSSDPEDSGEEDDTGNSPNADADADVDVEVASEPGNAEESPVDDDEDSPDPTEAEDKEADDNEDVDSEAGFVMDYLVNFHEKLDISRAATFGELGPVEKETYKMMEEEWAKHVDPKDESIKRALEYQKVGAAVICNDDPSEHKYNRRTLVADETGTGKTATAIYAAAYMSWKYSLPSVIISPTNDVAKQTVALAESMGIERRRLAVYSSASRGNGIIPLSSLTILVVVASRLTADFTTFGPAYIHPSDGMKYTRLPSEIEILELNRSARGALKERANRLKTQAKELSKLRETRIQVDKLMLDEANDKVDDKGKKIKAKYSSLFPVQMFDGNFEDEDGFEMRCAKRFAIAIVDEIHITGSVSNRANSGKKKGKGRSKQKETKHTNMEKIKKISLQALRVFLLQANFAAGLSGTPIRNGVMDAMTILAVLTGAPRACMSNRLIWRQYDQPEVQSQLSEIGLHRSAKPKIEHLSIDILGKNDERMIRKKEDEIIASLTAQRMAMAYDSDASSHLGMVMKGMSEIRQMMPTIEIFQENVKKLIRDHVAANEADSTEENECRRPFIFVTTFQDHADMLINLITDMDREGQLYKTRSVSAYSYTGKVSQSDRSAILQAYDDLRVDFLIVSTGCGAVGLNLQGPDPRTLAILDFPWTPDVLQQVIARCVRPGTKQTDVTVKWLYVANTICSWTRIMIQRKVEKAQKHFDADDIFNFGNNITDCTDYGFMNSISGVIREAISFRSKRMEKRVENGIFLNMDKGLPPSKKKKEEAAAAAESAASAADVATSTAPEPEPIENSDAAAMDTAPEPEPIGNSDAAAMDTTPEPEPTENSDAAAMDTEIEPVPDLEEEEDYEAIEAAAEKEAAAAQAAVKAALAAAAEAKARAKRAREARERARPGTRDGEPDAKRRRIE